MRLGRRREELLVREFEEKAFNDAMDIHNMSVESYLEGIVTDSIETTGDVIARESVSKYADELKEYETRSVIFQVNI